MENRELALVIEEVERTPEEYWPALIQLIRTFREAITLKPAEASFQQGWREASHGETRDIKTLWEGIDAE